MHHACVKHGLDNVCSAWAHVQLPEDTNTPPRHYIKAMLSESCCQCTESHVSKLGLQHASQTQPLIVHCSWASNQVHTQHCKYKSAMHGHASALGQTNQIRSGVLHTSACSMHVSHGHGCCGCCCHATQTASRKPCHHYFQAVRK